MSNQRHSGANHQAWANTTRKAHGVPCAHCGDLTYTKNGVCVPCRRKGKQYVAPDRLPEDYLMRCAQELLKRHNERNALLVKLGIKAVAA